MKNITVAAAFAVLIAVVLGCGRLNPFSEQKPASNSRANGNSNKSLTDQAVETAVGEQKIGVRECDELVDLLVGFSNDPDDGVVVKAGKTLVANKIRESIKQSLEENKTDKAQIARDCTTFKVELEKAMAEQKQ